MHVTFLGTASGGGPSDTRNCSSLVADIGKGSLWMFDCAEGTLRQFSCQPHTNQPRVSVNKISKMFITHMHGASFADHIMGIVPILRNMLYPPSAGESQGRPPRIEIYGPPGIRSFVRSILQMTYTKTSDRYVVHELLRPSDPITPCGENDLHASEALGRDILCSSEDGFWRGFTSGDGPFGKVFVDAGPIIHREECIGYAIRESVSPNRKIVILGDTSNPSAMLPLCASASLLIHEATDTHIPRHISTSLSKRSPEAVLEKTLGKGHSTPAMAGAFAKAIGAEKLILNHIGGRFPAPRGPRDTQRNAVVEEIERQATEAWGTGRRAQAASDYMHVAIPATENESGLEYATASWTPQETYSEGDGQESRKRGSNGGGYGDRSDNAKGRCNSSNSNHWKRRRN
ncbi:hypothetical protein PLEOSDRAFT_1080773 [Pleurotus ostreatus PC15]|uniref:Metallo-beta-lactamase domain-containing protein n=1 Tax=Pleurotus ostreatus (strain PC15) TaxID=1137138 RepID=A0A067P0C1_PLEO1|nr:hypothetical protein PLEOSDRAFT_1080773 [Pleurotus ostreatus PC15]